VVGEAERSTTISLSLDKEITFLRQLPGMGAYLGNALQLLQESVNNLGKNVAVDPVGTLPAPPAIQQLTVKTNGQGLVHAVITDNNAIQKHLNYFVEYDTDKNFGQPHVVHLGASRTMSPTVLPAMDDNGKPQKFFFRAYSQYQGSDPGPKVHSGVGVDPGGTHMLTLLPSTGSGTAAANGKEGGSGFGKILIRPATSSKRKN
jgi:hypothetical protein